MTLVSLLPLFSMMLLRWTEMIKMILLRRTTMTMAAMMEAMTMLTTVLMTLVRLRGELDKSTPGEDGKDSAPGRSRERR